MFLKDQFSNPLFVAEELRLMLNGSGEISTDMLKQITLFNNEAGPSEAPDKITKFKKWFWSVLEKMSTSGEYQGFTFSVKKSDSQYLFLAAFFWGFLICSSGNACHF